MKTLFIGQNIIRLKRVDSTNNYAAGLLRHTVIYDGTVVSAEFQEMGKGQRGNHWESEPGKNLLISIILEPKFLKPDCQFQLNKMVSLAICDLLESLEIKNISIKWPNDILVSGKKIAGILIENTLRSGEIIHSIIGIGLNVNQTKFNSPNTPVSLKIITGKNFSLDAILENLCSSMEARYLKLKSNNSAPDNDYLQTLYQLGKVKNYLVKGEKISATISGVNPDGLLILQKENGEEIFCDLKEVVFLQN